MKPLFTLLLSIIGIAPAIADEGMYPLSELKRIGADLKKAGLKLDLKDLYNPDGTSLVDALVNVGGCSGAFVSADGLIVTNHHCVFNAVQAASSVENDLVTNGFRAGSREEEIPAKGITVRITRAYRDVSDEIMKGLQGITDPDQRQATRNELISRIEKAAVESNPSLSAQVSDMLPGKVYVLFLYEVIRDVRLVYVPPRSIGEFGGETDNWIWPRHTGDFSFIRAWVPSDPADPSSPMVPFKPRRHLKVNADGAKEGDFVFIMGYPGRTFRHQPADFVSIQEQVELPYISSFYRWQIDQMESLWQGNPALELQQSARAKSLANVQKKSDGQLKGLRRLSLTDQKRAEEQALLTFIEADPIRKGQFGQLADSMSALYRQLESMGVAPFWAQQVYRTSFYLNAARLISGLSANEPLPDSLRPALYRQSNRASLANQLTRQKATLHFPLEERYIRRLLTDGSGLPSVWRPSILRGTNTDSLMSAWLSGGEPFHPDSVIAAIRGTRPLTVFTTLSIVRDAALLDQGIQAILKTLEKTNQSLVPLQARWVTLKQNWKGQNFIPDANGTLRLTYGFVRGYEPFDGAWYKPVSTISGLLEKANTSADFSLPEPVLKYYQPDATGTAAAVHQTPVAILYNTDTTGGNSGSAVMNARGELVALNFDRAWEATINDYAWSESYSRSIGVDVRYLIWVVRTIGKADYLLNEMGLK